MVLKPFSLDANRSIGTHRWKPKSINQSSVVVEVVNPDATQHHPRVKDPSPPTQKSSFQRSFPATGATI